MLCFVLNQEGCTCSSTTVAQQQHLPHSHLDIAVCYCATDDHVWTRAFVVLPQYFASLLFYVFGQS